MYYKFSWIQKEFRAIQLEKLAIYRRIPPYFSIFDPVTDSKYRLQTPIGASILDVAGGSTKEIRPKMQWNSIEIRDELPK